MTIPVIGISGRFENTQDLQATPIFSLARTYGRAVVQSGGAPVIIPPHIPEDQLRAIFARIDGLLLSGGGDIAPKFYREIDSGLLWRIDEERDQTEVSLARWAMSENLPVLGICRGVQVLNVAAGGTLIQDVATTVGTNITHSHVDGNSMSRISHTVEIAPDTRLAGLFGAGTLAVNSAHHQAVKGLGDGLIITARAPDGVIEGIESPEHPFYLGVQWHPEALVEEHPEMRGLFAALVAASRG